MSVDARTLIFFDASCLIAAAASPTGGSGFLWSLCERGFLTAVVSQPVLAEAEFNLLAKFPASALARHQQQQSSGAPLIAFVPRLNIAPRRYPAINAKDEHVVAAALTVEADFILTLDQGLTREINAAALSISAVSPGEFITTKLPQHPDFAHLRTSR